jgi:hypothetical protein
MWLQLAIPVTKPAMFRRRLWPLIVIAATRLKTAIMVLLGATVADVTRPRHLERRLSRNDRQQDIRHIVSELSSSIRVRVCVCVYCFVRSHR